MSPAFTTSGTVNRLIVWAAMAVAVVFLTTHLYQLIAAGGDEWRQGDWLITTDAGMVRRGLFGDALLWMSDGLGIGPLWVLGALQLGASVAVVIGLGVSVLRLGAPDRLVLALVAPTLILFWIKDPGSAYRKEILAYLAFLPLLAPLGARWAVPAAVLLYAIAVLGHEAMAFVAPFLALAIWFRFEGQVPAKPLGLSALVVLAVAAAGMLFAMRYSTLPDIRPICRRLHRYDLAPDFCKGAIFWLTQKVDHNLVVADYNIVRYPVLPRIAMYLACLTPAVLALAGVRPSAREARLIGLAFLAVFPLYLVAIDWGRWLSLQTFGLTFLAVILAQRRGPPPGLAGAILYPGIAVCLALSPHFVRLLQRPELGNLIGRLF